MSSSENCWVSEEGGFSLAHVIVDYVEKGKAADIRGGLSSISKSGDEVERNSSSTDYYVTFIECCCLNLLSPRGGGKTVFAPQEFIIFQ